MVVSLLNFKPLATDSYEDEPNSVAPSPNDEVGAQDGDGDGGVLQGPGTGTGPRHVDDGSPADGRDREGARLQPQRLGSHARMSNA